MTGIRTVFFARPPERTFVNPKMRLMTPMTCQPLARTLDVMWFFDQGDRIDVAAIPDSAVRVILHLGARQRITAVCSW